MGILSRRPPWYVAGLAFECTGCGRCCSGPQEGYVWATNDEIAAMAKKLGMDEAALRETYVRKIGRRYSLKEDPASKDCVFLTETTEGGRGCAVYDVRPMQCRTWPFWPGNLSSGEAWAAAGMRCRGINRGPLHDCDEIDAKKDATR